MKLCITKEKVCGFLFVLSALIMCFAPYQTDSTLSLSNEKIRLLLRIIQYIICAITLIIGVFPQLKKHRVNRISLIHILPILIYFSMIVFNNYYGGIIISGLLGIIQWIIFALSSEKIQSITFRYLKNAIFIISVLGIICYLNYTLKLFIPYEEVNYYTLNNISTYIDYKIIFLFKGIDFSSSSQIVRLCGIFNEPGFIGTIAALILSASDFNLKDKKNIIILIAGMMSFSLAFALISILYLILKYSKNIKTFIIVIIIIFAYINILPNIHTNNANINNIIQRMTITENGLLGDNRSKKQLDLIFDYSIRTKPIFGFGDGYLQTQNTGGGNLTYKIYVIQYGIFGCLLMWGSLLLASLYKNKNNINVFFYIIIFFLSIYQRPHIFNLMYQILLFGGILYVKDNKNIKKEN